MTDQVALILALFAAFAVPMILVAVMLAKATWDNAERINHLKSFAGDMSERIHNTEEDVSELWADFHSRQSEDEDDDAEAWKGN